MASAGSFRALLGRSVLPVSAAAVTVVSFQTTTRLPTSKSQCDAPRPPPQQAGFQRDAEGDFNGLFPKRQFFQPKLSYPLWDDDWDGRKPPSCGDADLDRKQARQLRQRGTTRHLILVRHGQYDESHKEDSKRILTPLGRQQAELTGKRIAELMADVVATTSDGEKSKETPIHVKVVRVSDMARAKETADIICQQLPREMFARSEPDPNLNEGKPCHNIPGSSKASQGAITKTDEQHDRIEKAFQTYFHRADEPPPEQTQHQHEFEIIVGHANVMRYFTCRALQLPPEAWLRLCTFNCSLTYLTIRPTGSVSLRSLGDTGHLPYSHITFSGHHGYNW